ncbi:MAG: PadR family transcriptional regulator [Chloroflexi bacterium]|nr:PadR family transcriptional regulator [Chloroflexota bacterium]
MSLHHAILGLLSVMPMTGYDLKTQAFDESVTHFWQADQSQIYRSLSKMEEDGWLTYDLEVQDGRPNRKVYHLTTDGRTELDRWLRMAQPLPVNREAFLVQLFFGWTLTNQTLLELVAGQRAGHAARLAEFAQIPMPPLEDPQIDRMRTLWRLTLELGMAIERTYLDWLDQCTAVITNLPEADKAKPQA